jgi:membrane protein
MGMFSHTPEKPAGSKRTLATTVVRTLVRESQPLQAFWNKFNNDWSWNHAAGLAYNLMLAMFPLVIALLALIGVFLGRLDPGAYDTLIQRITTLLPAITSSQHLIKAALHQLTRDSGFLGVFAIVFAIFNGSRLFLFLEGCFDIIYQVRPRGVLAMNVMSLVMLLLFVVLLPLMVVASTLPALVFSLLKATPLDALPASGFLFSLGGVFGGLLVGYIFFQVIYMAVPNQRISFQKSWLGAVVATVLLELYLTLFPLYVIHFLGSFAGALGLLILLIFFYYFALILFLGAEVNAFFSQGIHDMPYDLATMVHVVTNVSSPDIPEEKDAHHPANETERPTPSPDMHEKQELEKGR